MKNILKIMGFSFLGSLGLAHAQTCQLSGATAFFSDSSPTVGSTGIQLSGGITLTALTNLSNISVSYMWKKKNSAGVYQEIFPSAQNFTLYGSIPNSETRFVSANVIIDSLSASLAGVSLEDAGDYAIEFWTSCTSPSNQHISSGDTQLYVYPRIDTQPVSQARNRTTAINLTTSIFAESQASLRFQWYKDGAILNASHPDVDSMSRFQGATTANLTIQPPHTARTAGQYVLHISHIHPAYKSNQDDYGSLDTDQALVVLSSTNPSGDGFCAAPAPARIQDLQIYNFGTSAFFGDARFRTGLGACQFYGTDPNLGADPIYRCDDSVFNGASSNRVTYLQMPQAQVNSVLGIDYVLEKQNGPGWTTIDSQTNALDITSSSIPNFSINPLMPSHSGNYRVRVTRGPCSGVAGLASSIQTLNVQSDAPVISSVTVTTPRESGATAHAFRTQWVQLDANFSNPGSFPTYQWYKVVAGVEQAISGATSTSHFINQAEFSDAGIYRFRAFNSAAPAGATGNDATLIVDPIQPTTVTIVAVPNPATVIDGQSISFSLAMADGDLPQYEWQRSPNGVNYSPAPGNNSQAFYSFQAALTDNNTFYRLRVYNSSGSALSSAVPVQVNRAAPTIVQQPSNQSASEGGSVSFVVVANGSAPLSYQWKKAGVNLANGTVNGTVISGVTSNTLSLSNIRSADAATNYSVTVTNQAGSIPSSDVSLTVNLNPPAITSQPQALTVPVGGNAIFSVSASGSNPLTYQWKKNGGNISGATSSTYQINSVQLTDDANYSVTVTNSVTNVTSNSVRLTVQSGPSITTQPVSISRTVGQTASFSVTASGTGTLTYQWKKDGADLTNGGRITGATSATLSIASVISGDAAGYSVLVRDPNSLSIQSSAATLTVNAATCAAPTAPSLSSPAAGAVLSILQPTFNWTAATSADPTNCPVSYSVFVGTDSTCTNNPSASTSGLSISSFSLSPTRTYSWCVRAGVPGGAATLSSVRTFTTAGGDIPTPQIQIIPNGTTANARGGETRVLIQTSNVEVDTVARLYVRRDGVESEVNSGLVTSASGINFSYDIPTTVQGEEEFEFRVRLERPETIDRPLMVGPYSNPLTYYYNSNLSIPTPRINPAGGGVISWFRVNGAARYEVYRRINKAQNCSGTCYLNTPFSQVATINDVANQTSYAFNENLATLGLNAEGASYFVVAVSPTGTKSLRSDSVSQNDSATIQIQRDANNRALQRLQVRSRGDGTIDIYVADLNGFQMDNSADLIIYVQYQERSGSCTNFVFDDNKNTLVPNRFDALRIINDQNQGLSNAVLAQTAFVQAGRTYCFEACIKDVSGNPQEPAPNSNHCLKLDQAREVIDTSAPNFTGLTDVVPGVDGRSIIATWPRAVTDVSLEEPFIGYTVFYSEHSDMSNARALVVEDIDTLTATITGLDSNKRYYLYAESFDAFGNRRDGRDRVLDTSTLDNYPRIPNVEFRPSFEPGYVEMCLNIQDRNLPQGDQVKFKSLSIGRAATSLQSVSNIEGRVFSNSQVFQGVTSVSGTSVDTCTTLNLADVLRIEDYEGFHYSIEVQDSTGLIGTSEGETSLYDNLSIETNEFAGQAGGISCTTLDLRKQNASMVLVLLGAFAMLLVIIRRRKSF